MQKMYYLLSVPFLLHAADEVSFDQAEAEVFYDVFVCEEKAILSAFDLTTGCSHTPLPPPPP
ncbi:MAG: hypothetical protein RLZZ453_1282, partial [Chlamydiota bacterium]